MDDAGRRYIEQALAGVVAELAETGTGGRNDALNRAAFRLGQLLPNWPLTREAAEAALFDAIAPMLDRSMGEREARYTIRHGLTEGERKPQARDASGPSTWCASGNRHTPAPRPGVRPVRPPDPPPRRPPADEVAALWNACLPVDTASEAPLLWDHDPVHWLVETRGLDVDLVAGLDLARMIPDGVRLPAWAGLGSRTWPEAGYRLLVRGWNDRGELVSLHARRTLLPEQKDRKTLWTRGYECRGLVFANGPALALLRGQNGPSVVVIAEGLTDWLSGAIRWPDAAVFGITGGSWWPEHARRIPDGATVVVRTDPDATGEKYRAEIVDTFKGRKVALGHDKRSANEARLE